MSTDWGTSSPVEPGAHQAGWTALVEDSGVAVLILDIQGVILFANSVAAEVIGVPAEALAGKKYAQIVPADLGEERVAIIRRVAETGIPIVLEHTVNGCRRRTALRPLAADAAGNSRVLMVCRPAYTETIQGKTGGAEYVQARHNDLGILAGLTPRELEILCLIGQGMGTADIAKHLQRSEKTVEWHRVSLGSKLGVSNRIELARVAFRAGLVPGPQAAGV